MRLCTGRKFWPKDCKGSLQNPFCDSCVPAGRFETWLQNVSCRRTAAQTYACYVGGFLMFLKQSARVLSDTWFVVHLTVPRNAHSMPHVESMCVHTAGYAIWYRLVQAVVVWCGVFLWCELLYLTTLFFLFCFCILDWWVVGGGDSVFARAEAQYSTILTNANFVLSKQFEVFL